MWGECDEYGGVYLRCDHIKKIIKVTKINARSQLGSKKCVYKVSKKRNLPENDASKIIKITPEYIKIREEYSNDFYLKQKLLSYGSELIDVEDEKIKSELIKIIQDVEEMYI